MKKVNPKVVTVVTMLLSLLIGGAIAADKVIGEQTVSDKSLDDTGMF